MKWSLRKALGLELRDNPESISSSATAEEIFAFFGLNDRLLPSVTPDSAMKVPAYAAGRSFLSSSLANLPLHAYRDKDGNPERIGGTLQRLLNEAPNSEWSSYGARKYFWSGVFGERGRGLFWIERKVRDPIALWPMDPTLTTVKRQGVNKIYEWNDQGTVRRYAAGDVIDVPFLLKPDQLSTYSTLSIGDRALQKALAMQEYGAQFFSGGGVPPLALTGPLPQGPDAMKRAMEQVQRAVDAAKSSNKPIFPLPPDHKLEKVGYEPDKAQMTDALRFQIEEIARVFNLPPAFLQDLTHGTFSNVEQQDLNLVKHCIAQWAKAFEDELNLKLFGAENNRRYVEHSLEGLMRGDFQSRSEGLARAIQTGQLTPNEARALDNRPPLPGGDDLLIQGATIPLQNAGKQLPGTPPPADGGKE